MGKHARKVTDLDAAWNDKDQKRTETTNKSRAEKAHGKKRFREVDLALPSVEAVLEHGD